MVRGDIPFLPEGIIANILKRLPVKCLMRFRCVCKHWKNLFKTPSFIEDHLRHSRQNPFLLFQGCRPLRLSLLGHEMHDLDIQNAPLIDFFDGHNIVGSSNGLLCFHLHDASIFLWNPSTREVRQVSRAISLFHAMKSCVGFGFSPMVNDYKIVRFYGFDIKEVQVYSLSTGTWKDVKLGNLDGVVINPNGFAYNRSLDGVTLCSESNGIAKNGAIFWFGLRYMGEEAENYDLIVSFDIALEVFTLIPFPPSAPKAFTNKLAVLDDKLAMLSGNTSGSYEHSVIDLWVMEEESAGASGERWSWTKKYSTNPYPYFFAPWIIWKNEIVCVHPLDDVKQKILLFNLTTHEFKTVATWRYHFGDHIFNYVESLVPTD